MARGLLATMFGGILVLFTLFGGRTPVAKSAWNPYSYKYDAGVWPGVGYTLPSTGALMNGQGCIAPGNGSDDFRFLVWGSTLITETSYWIWTYVEGQDTCGGMGGTYLSRNSSSGVAYNATSGSSGNGAAGSSYNCASG